MDQAPSEKKRSGPSIKTVIRVLILGVVAWGIYRTVAQARDAFAEQDFAINQVQPLWLVVAGVFYLLGMVPSWLFWHQTLVALGQQPRYIQSLKAFYIGHLGKYVPGKAMVVVLRTGLVKSETVDTTVAATSVFVETLSMMAVGATVAAGILAIHAEHLGLISLSVFLMFTAGVPTLPPIFRRVVRMLQLRRASAGIDTALEGLSWRLMLFGWISIALGWVLFGCSLWATLASMPGVNLNAGQACEQLPLLIACVSLAMVAGFLSLLPGGIGVREFVVMQLLAGPFGAVAAIVSALLLRLVWLFAELAIAAILYLVPIHKVEPRM